MPTKLSKQKSTKSEPTCDICCEEFNKSTHKLIDCMYCHKTTCVKCVRTYLLTTYDEPHCMRCKTAWNRDFWMDKVPKSFINDELKVHREKILLEREKSLMPATQPIVEQIVRRKKFEKEVIELAVKKIPISQEIQRVRYDVTITEDERYEKLKKLAIDKSQLEFEIDYRNLFIFPNAQKQEARAVFVRACPVNDCRGFLSSRWKCGICENYTCKDCHDVIGKDPEHTEHTCKPEAIATAKLLDKDSRPCPKCASLIFKQAGCDQMFCTQCNTPFSWETGQVITTGVIHNPHYFEYLRHNPTANANLTQDNCGNMPDYYSLRTCMKNLGITDVKLIDTITSEFTRGVMHNEHVEMRRYTMRQNDTQELRVKYLMNEITEDKFKRTIQIMEKAFVKGRDILRVMQLHNTVCKDIANRLLVAKTKEEFITAWSEVNTIDDYAMEQMKIISKRYCCKTPHIRRFIWTRVKPTPIVPPITAN